MSEREYALRIPKGLYDEVYALAAQYRVTPVAVMQKVIRLGFLALLASERGDTRLLWEEGEMQTEIVVVWGDEETP